MVTLSDIPCVGVAVDIISVATVKAAIRGLNYTFCTKSLVDDLNTKIKEVTIPENDVKRKVVESKDDGKIIKVHVTEWQEEVENIKTVADGLSRKRTSCSCFNVLRFPNPVYRFRVGRKAAYQSKDVDVLTASGKDLLTTEIAYLPAVEYSPTSGTYQNFDSRQEAYNKLLEALVNEDVHPVIGVYGMAGAGKTRMAEQACKNAMDKKSFKKFALVAVGGEKLNVIDLQEKLAACLSCTLGTNNEKQRASQLKTSILAGIQSIIMFDDVWEKVPLSDIGIPVDDKGIPKNCKILFTSRDKQQLFVDNKCEDPIKINQLTDVESLEMFRNTVGNNKLESLQDSSLAARVCKQCGYLPLLIDALGNLLKYESRDSWEDTLSQFEEKLKNHKEIDGIDKVYTFLDCSFEKLTDAAAKKFLFLCCLFPEDADIDIKMLFDMAKGSGLLDSRRNIVSLVNKLISSSLLLQGKDDYTVKVHDIFRGVARSLAAKDPTYAFLSISSGSWMPDNAGYPTNRLLHIDLAGENVCFPDNLVWPEAHTLLMQSNKDSQQLSSGFFKAFSNLKVLLLKGMRLPEDQLSVSALDKLKVLILDGCQISQTFVSSVSKSLETLSIWSCDLPARLDLPELTHLRKLELLQVSQSLMPQASQSLMPQESRSLRIGIVGKAISRLSNLEELNIPCGFTTLGGTLIYEELSQLGGLRKLVISLDDSSYLDIVKTFPKLDEFNINVGPAKCCDSKEKSVTTFGNIQIESDQGMANAFTMVERAEKVELLMFEGFPNGLSDGNMREGFAKLKELKIDRCHDMEHVASWEEEIQPLMCFSNLSIVDISTCSKLTYVFSSGVAKCLLQMQTLKVSGCRQIQEIVRIDDDEEEEEILRFPNLKEVELKNLPNLKGFYGDRVVKKETEIKGRVSEFKKLKVFRVSMCHKLKYVIPVSMLYQMENLETLFIDGCKSLKAIVQQFPLANIKRIDNGRVEFPALTTFTLNARNLESFWNYEHDDAKQLQLKVAFPNIATFKIRKLITVLENEIELGSKLTSLIVSDYDSSEIQPLSSEIQPLPPQWQFQLQNLETMELENSWRRMCSLFYGAMTFKTLRKLQVSNSKATTLVTSSVFRSLYQLEELKVSQCSSLEEIVLITGYGINEKTPVSLHNLKSVYLTDLPNLQTSGISAFSMPALVRVDVHRCERIAALFTRSAFRSLHQLQELNVSDCSLLKEIVEEDTRGDGIDEKTPISLPQLKSVGLKNLPNLQSSGISACSMPALVKVDLDGCERITTLFTRSAFRSLHQLEELKVSNCSSLEEIVEDNARDDGINKKRLLSLPQLKSVYLTDLPNLQRSAKSAFTMPALVRMDVHRCERITTLFTHSAFRSLYQLNEIRISYCSSLEEIVEDARGASFNKKTFISLPQLKSVYLTDLPNLRRSGISACHMPALVMVNVQRCERIDTLFKRSTFRSLHQLKDLKVSYCSSLEEIVEDARGDGINEKTLISLPQLESVYLTDLPNLRRSGISACHMPALVMVDVQRCERIDTLFTRSTFRSLHQLKDLKVSYCSSLEEIVEEDARGDGINEKTPISLPQLKSVYLTDLPNLQSSGISAFSMPALVRVEIHRCKLIRTLFTRSAFNKLELLEQLEVSQSPLLEEIVEDEVDEETPGTGEKMISLSSLRIIKLGQLPRLKSFSSSSTYTFNMPALDSVHLYECPCIDKFTSLLVTAPLVKIFSEFKYIKDVSDLNNFLRAEPKDNINTQDGAND